MRLKIKQTIVGTSPSPIISAWFANDTFITVSDDKTIRSIKQSINQSTSEESVLLSLDFYPTAVARLSNNQSSNQSTNQPEQIALGGSDGAIRFISSSLNRIERVVSNAHVGAITALVWSLDGAQLASAGEDGTIKLWSKAGNLRSKLVDLSNNQSNNQSINQSINCLQWLTNNSTQTSTLLYACGEMIHFHPLINQSINQSNKPLSFRAHSGAVTSLSYHPVYRSLVTAGNDNVFRIWDEFGQLLYSSPPMTAITNIAWSKTGDVIAIGGYDFATLIDRGGWVHERVKINSGSCTCVTWAADGRRFVLGGMNGTLHTATLIKRTIESNGISVELTENNTLLLSDLSLLDVGNSVDNRLEELDFTHPLLEFALSSWHLLAVTSDAIQLYSAPSFTSPVILPLKTTPRVVHLTKNVFSLMDSRGLYLYSTQGKALPTPRLPPAVDFENLHEGNTCLSNDLFVFVVGGNSVYFLEIETGKMLCDPLIHTNDILSVRISQSTNQSINQSHILILDRQKDCYVVSMEHLLNNQAMNQSNTQSNNQNSHSIKLAGQVTSLRWHSEVSMCMLISDATLVCHYCPMMSFVDKELAPQAVYKIECGPVGAHAELVMFESSRCTVRRSDGTLQAYSIPPSALALHRALARSEWSSALACCRLMNDPRCWSMLAACSIQAAQLDLAEQCLAACDEVTKLRKIQTIKSIPSSVARTAWLLAYQHHFDAAETLLLTNGMHYRAIQLALERARWIRAISLATQFQSHIDTVLQARRAWLQSTGKDEIEPVFMQLGEVQVDAEQIRTKINQEMEKERSKQQEYVSQLPIKRHVGMFEDKQMS